ncbi:MAG: hypothetical protein HFG31_03390 [Eubacterium sp.]|nr:hypothetical protein [Eubacterium sp.]
MKKIYISGIAFVLGIFILTNVCVYAVTNKSVLDYFFKENNSYISNELLYKDGQSYDIDGYTIKLEEALYEKNTQLGYLVFSIKKDDGKPEAEINDAKQCVGGFGEEQRFSFDFESSGSADMKYEYVGDVLYAYISFEADNFENEKSNKKIVLVDGKNWSDKTKEEFMTYDFNLRDRSKCLVCKEGNSRFYISPLGIKVFTVNEKINRFKFKFTMVDGETETMEYNKDTVGVRGRGGRDISTERIYTIKFSELKDISRIKQIEFNGKILTLK